MITLISSHFQFAAQYPKQHAEQKNARSDQDRRVVGENAHDQECSFSCAGFGGAEIAFFCAEKNVRLSAAPVIILLHLGVRDQIRDFLVYEKLLSCDWALGIVEGSASEGLLSAQDAINERPGIV